MADSFSSEIDLKRIITEQLVLLWRRKWLAVGLAWVLCVLGWGYVMTLPRTYEADATIFVDVDGLLTPLLRGMIIENNSGRELTYIRQTLLSRPNVEQIVHLSNLDIDRSENEITALVDRLSNQIQLTGQGQNIYQIAYRDRDPEIARMVVESVITIFSENAAATSRVEMDNAQGFLNRQIETYEQQLREAEQRRAEFRRNFSEYLPNDATGVSRLNALEAQVRQMSQSYEDALTSRGIVAKELERTPRFINPGSAPTVTADGQLVGAPTSVRLAQARAQLAQLRQRYTDLHPSVIATMREVASLEEQIANEGGPESADQGAGQISNPVYEQISLRLVDMDVALQAARNRLNDAIAERDRVRTLFEEVPDIEARSINLDRDYEVLRGQYEELLRRREAAVLSQAAENEADRTQFRIIEPPVAPQSPSSPNFPVMLSLVLVFGLGAGAGVPLGYDFLRGSYASASGLRELGLPVIGSVTFVSPPGKKRDLKSGLAGPAATVTGLLLVYAILVFGSTSLALLWA